MMYNLREAAEAVGKSKATISVAIKEGKISATKNELGRYEISPAELHRVYKPKPSNDETKQTQTPSNTPKPDDRDNKIKELELKLQLTEERLDDIKEERDAWRKQANALLASPAKNEAEQKTLWKRIFG